MGFGKGNSSQVENHGVEKPRGKFRSCLRKWWWAILIVFAICVLVIILPIVFVAIPKIIQHKVDSSVLTIDGISVTQTKTNTVLISINSSVSSSDSIHATIDGFDAKMYLEDKHPHETFATLRMPETETGISLVNVTQEITGAALQPFIDFNSWYLWNESFPVTVEGETHVNVKGLRPTKVTFKKTITLKGINGFKGLEVTKAHVALQADENGDNFHGFADIPNVSILTLEVGNATFGNYLDGKRIGGLFIDDMFIVPGINNVSVRANITQAPVLLAVASEPYCHTGIIPFGLKGESVINHGQPLPYFAESLALHEQMTEIDIGTALEETLGAKVAVCPGGKKKTE